MPRFSIPVDGQRVRQERLTKGWLQEDLARQAGLSQKTVSIIETTNRTEPHSIENIARALGCSVYELLPRAQGLTVQLLRITVDRKIDAGREKMREWGKWVGKSRAGQWSEEWFCLKDALKYGHEAVEYDPTYTRGWTFLASVYQRIGQEELLAKQCLARSYEIALQSGRSPGDFYNEVDKHIRTGYPFAPTGSLTRQPLPPGFKDVYQPYWTE